MLKSPFLTSIVFGVLTISSAAMASDPTQAFVTLGGTVTSTLEVTPTPTGAATALELMSGIQIVNVADVEMDTNNEQGLALSASAGNLTKTGGTSIAYLVTSVTHGGTAPLAGAFSAGPYTVFSTSTNGSVLQDLYIKYTPAAQQDPGDYAGEITLNVSDN